MAPSRRFPIRISPVNGMIFRALLIRPSSSYVELDGDTVNVRLGWAFTARIPRRVVTRTAPGRAPRIPFTAGAHGWAGRWLVNGAPDGIVTLELSEPTRAFVAGFPIRLKELSVSLEEPESLLAAVA